MSGGGHKSTTQTTKIDPDIKNRLLDVYSRAEGVADQPFQLYTGQRFAPVSSDQEAALAALRGNAGLLQGQLEPGIAALQASTDPDVRDVSAVPIAGLNTAQFLNPYTDQVIDRSLSDLDRARQMAIGRGEDLALAANAFGGSRHGVADAQTNEAFARQAASTAAGLRQQGFSQAQDVAQRLALANAQQGMTAQQANQAADLSRAQLEAQAGQRLTSLGLGGAGLLSQVGDFQQQQAQRPLDFAYQQFLAQQSKPRQDIGLLSSVLSGFPTGQSVTQTQPGGSPLAGGLGGALGGGSLAAKIPGAGPWGIGAGALAGGLLGIFG